MVPKGPAVLALAGLMLLTMLAGALKIHSLEERVASVERGARSPAISFPVTAVGSPARNLFLGPARDDLPEGATRHEINGMAYYVMPLADRGDVTSRR
jgi:hypothetical protein